MKFNKKYCLLFLMTVLVLLLGAGMVSASEAGSDVQVVKDNQGLSTPDNYDVDNVVQSDRVLTKSEANVEKTSTKYDKDSENDINSTFVNQTDTNEDIQKTSEDSHSVKIVEDSTLDDDLMTIANPTLGLLQESEGVIKFGTSPVITEELTSSEKMTPIFTEVEINDNPNNVITKTSQDNDLTVEKQAPGDDSERYSVLYHKNGAGWLSYSNPYIMNDSTPVFSLNGSVRNANTNENPQGYSPSIAPGVYKRIELTDDYQLIHPLTGEDVIPYVRTLVYKNLTSANVHTVINYFTDFRYNYRTRSLPTNYRKAVDDTIALVESGNGVPNSGTFNASKNLKYQFYLYQCDSEVSTRHYQDLIGFNLLRDINVTKVWDDEGNESQRPDSVEVQLYANGEKMGNPVSITADDDWKHTYENVPVYYGYNTDSLTPLTYGEDYKVTESEVYDVVNIHLHKVWDPDYTGIKKNYVYYNLYANGKFYLNYAMTNNTYYGTGNWNIDHNFLPYSDEDGNPIEWTVIETNQTGIAVDDEGNHIYEETGYIEMTISEPFQVKNLTYTFINDELRKDQLFFSIFIGNTRILSANVTEADNWTYLPGTAFLLEPADDPADFNVYLRPSTSVINYTIKETSNGYAVNVAEEDISVYPLTLKGYENLGLKPLAQNFTITNKYYEQAIDIHEDYGLNYILGENATVSNETYSVVVDWSGSSFNNYAYPWLMNDTTWVQCLEPGSLDPDGNGMTSIPPNFRRITLTDDDQIIHPITGEDILPFLRTMIYLYTTYPEEYGIITSRSGAPAFQALLDPFIYGVNGNYRDPESRFNRIMYNGKNVWEYVEPIIAMVDSGNAISSSGVFNNSDFLTYQFYMYVDDESNPAHFQNTLGFHVLTKINVTKVWDDNNLINLRPENISVQLYANGEAVGENVTLNSSNNWKYTYSELPVYSVNTSVPITSDDYTVSSESETCYNVTIKKVWAEDYTGRKPNYVYYIIYADGQQISSRMSLRYYYDWETSFPYFTKYDPEDGHEIEYTFVDVTNYGSGIDPASTGNIEIIEKSADFDVKTMTYTITDEELCNEPFTVGIYIDGIIYDAAPVSSSNDWTFSIYNLPADLSEDEVTLVKFIEANINVINYTIGELEISDEYTSTTQNTTESLHPLMTSRDENPDEYVKYLDEDLNELLTSVTITNTRELTVTKVWEDSEDKDLIRPSEITVNIKVGDETVDTVVLSESNNWTQSIKDLPKYDEDNNLIEYSVEEAEIPEDYTVNVSSEFNYYVITNTHIPKYYNITVTKIWDDEDNKDSYRPDEITVQLLANGEVCNETTLNESNNWTHDFINLPEYIDGNKVEYSLNESPVPSGYIVSYKDITPVPVKNNTAISIELLNVTTGNGNTAKINVVVRDEHGTPVSEGHIIIKDDDGAEIFSGDLTDGLVVANIPIELVPEESPVGNESIPAIRFNINIDYEENDLYYSSSNSFTSFDDLFVYAVVDSRNISLDLKYVTINGNTANATYLVTVTDADDALVNGGYIVLTNSRGTIISNNTLVDGKTVISIPVTILSDGISEEGLPDFIFNATILYYDETFVNTTMPMKMVNETRAQFSSIIEKRSMSTGDINTRTSSGEPSAPWIFSDGVWTYCIDPSLQYYGWEPSPYLPYYAIYDPDNIILNNNISMPYLKVSITDDTDIANYLYHKLGLTYNPDALDYFKTILYNYGNDSTDFELDVFGSSSQVHNMIHIFTGIIMDYTDPSTYYPLDVETLSGQNLSYYINKVIEMVEAGEVPDNHGIKNYTEGGRWEYQFYIYYPYTYYFGEEKYQRTIGIEYNFVPEENPYETEITNRPYYVNLTVNKVWNDTDDENGIRPESISIQLLANGEAFGEAVELSQSNNWTYNFELLPVVIDGVEVNYTVNETPVPEGYEVTYNTTVKNNTKLDTEVVAELLKVDAATAKVIVKLDVFDSHADLVKSGHLTVYDADGNVITEVSDLTDGYVIIERSAEEDFFAKVVYEENDEYYGCEREIPEADLLVATAENPGYNPWLFTDGTYGYCLHPFDRYDPDYPPMDYVRAVITDQEIINTNTGESVLPYIVTAIVRHAFDSENFTTLDNGAASQVGTMVSLFVGGKSYWNFRDPDTYWDIDVNTKSGKPLHYFVNEIIDLVDSGQAADSRGIYEIDGNTLTSYKLYIYYPFVDVNEYYPSSYKNLWQHVIAIELKEFDTSNMINITVTDTHDVKTQVNVTKVWDDDNHTSLRPNYVTVQLYINETGNLIEVGEPVALSEENNWTYVFEDLDKYDEGVEIVYVVDEVPTPKGYNKTIVNQTTGKLVIEHVWDADVAADNVPESITVLVYADGEQISSVTLNPENNWKEELDNLSKFNSENKTIEYRIVYTLGEETINNTVALNTTNFTFTINNKYYFTSLNVTKVWNDTDNQDGKRTDSITVELLADNEKTGKFAVLNESNNWNYNYTYLPVYDEEGNIIEYSVDEVSVPEGYTKTVTNVTTFFNITNTHIPELVNISVEKVWNDSDNQDGIRPANITVGLFGDHYLVDWVVLEDPTWTHTFTDLPKYADGEEISYYVDEIGLIIFDDIAIKSRDNVMFFYWDYVPAGYTKEIIECCEDDVTYIINTHVPEKTNITVVKNWTDDDNKVNIRPPSIVVHVYVGEDEAATPIVLSEDNNWEATFTDLDVYENGEAIEYVVVEDVPNNYTESYNCTVNITISRENMIILRGLRASENEPIISDDEVIVTFNLIDGNENVIDSVSIPIYQYYGDEYWNHTFADLPVYDDNGEVISYSITGIIYDEEFIPELYEDINMTYSYAVNINNTITGITGINVTKVWDDNENNDGKRPGSVTVNLVIDGEVSDLTRELSDENNWTDSFEELEMYHENGTLIVYNVTEPEVPEDYELTGIVFCEGVFKVINSHTPDVVNVTVYKQWEDADNQDNVRPAQVTLKLKSSDGREYVAVLEGVGNKWNYTFTDLPKYADGQELVYSVEETVVVDGYTVEYDQDTLTVTNTHEPITKIISVLKVWNDDNNNDGVRPEYVTIELYAGDTLKESVELRGPLWAHVFGELPVYEPGKVGMEIVYTIKENDLLPLYTSEVSDNGNGYFTVTNTHENEVVDVEITKVWNDTDNQDGIRPGNVTVELFNGTDVVQTAIVNGTGNTWTYKFTNLTKYNNGQEIKYTVREVVPTGYNESYSEDTFTITNTHVPELVNISVAKVWDDSDNQDGKRVPVTVNLMVGEEIIDSIELNVSNEWKHTFTDLPKYADGEEIVYNVTESVVPDGYTAEVVFCEGVFKVINSHTPDVVNVTVYKQWEDADNQDNVRPAQVTLKLKSSDGREYVAVLEGVGNKWNYTFTDLPKFADGQELVYSVEETVVVDGCTVEYDQDTLTVTNTHEPITKNITVIKVWNDNDNNDNVRPTKVTVELYADNVLNQTVDLTGPDWNYTFTNLTVYKAGEVGVEIVYTIREPSVSNYTSEVSNVGDDFTVTNTHENEVVDVEITKEWNDTDNQDGIRPDNVTVQLLNGEEIVQTVVVNGTGNTWTYTFTNLPKFNNKELIVYTAQEVVPAGYNVSYSEDTLTITNTHITENTTVNVTKVWDDADNNDGKRVPVVVDLMVGDEVIASVELNESNEWKHTFTDLPKYANGEEIVYTVSEASVPEGYTADVVFCEGVFKVINTHVPEVVNVTVYKEWDDSDNQDNVRPKQVTIKLKSDDGREYVAVVEGVNNRWNYTFTDLPKYGNGEELVYTVEESIVVDGYTVEYDQDTLTVTNIHEPITKNISVVKVWNDNNNNDGVRPSNVTVELYADNVLNRTVDLTGPDWNYTFTNLTVYKAGEVGVEIVYTIREPSVSNYTSEVSNVGDNFTVTNTHNDSKVNITINKEWEDENNIDNIRPDFVTVRLLADNEEYATAVVEAGEGWTYTFTNLPEYNNTQKITYTIEEANVPKDYTPSVDGLTITNTHIPYVTEINVTKVWNDDDNINKARSTSVLVELFADGEKINETTLNDDNDWKATFDNLPLNKEGGIPIVYNISEVHVDRYDTVITENNGNFIITNTLVPEFINITVNKTWDDSDNQDGIRPESITVQVLNGQNVVQTAVVTGTGNNWNYTFENLPKYENGEEIVYTVKEVVPTGYNVTVNGYEIVNTHIPDVKEINVTKIWDDNNNNDNARSTSIIVKLFDGEENIENATLNADNDWKATFDNLPVNRDGKAINYTIEEVTVDHYITNITENNGNYIITNTLVPELVNVTVNKVWNDSDNQDGIRPAEVTLKLKADGKEYMVKVVKNENGDWTYTFTDLPKFNAGKEIVYTVEEVNIANGYTVTYSEDTLNITNTHVPEVTEVEVAKVWDDNDNQDGKRTGSVTVDLLADGQVVDTVVLNASNDWKHTFTDLAKYADGQEIVYTVNESNVPAEYTVEVVFCEGVFKVVNSYIPENTSISVSKVWEDADNQDAIRPNAIFVQVLANGENYQLVKLSSDNDWTETIDNLPKYSKGQEIVYTIVESEVPEGYTAVVDGLTIINTHVPEVTSVNVTKVWNDNDNNDGVRPAEVSVDLFADGVKVNSTVLSEGNDWKATFENLPVNKDGKAIKYTISEVNVENYTSEVVECCGNFKVINTHNDSTVEINITKVWVDDDNRDAIRPATVSVRVLADGEEYTIVVVKASDDWMVTVTDLPEYNNGNKVVYTVEEVEVPAGYTAVVEDTTITNTHEILTKEVDVSKVWNDNNNNDGVRPDNVTVYLYANGKEFNHAVLSEDNDWKATFVDLPVYDDGEEIVYTIGEAEIADYTSVVVNCNGTFKVINTHNDSTVEITITKVWEDADNQDGVRPDSVTVKILADDVVVQIAVISEADGWTYTFTDLPKYADGQEIVYTVEEVVPTGYNVTYNGNEIINTHIPLVTEVNVTKIWNDNNNNDGQRPATVTIKLLGDNEVVATYELGADDEWKHTFTNLPLNREGKQIVYTVTEDAVEGYTTSIVNCEGIFKVINSHNDSKVNITITKVWDDHDNQDATRPENITVSLLADGEEYLVAVVKAGEWTYTFENLPEYNKGNKVVYTIQEVSVPKDYTVTYDQETLTITNCHEIYTKDINVSKVWNDSDNNDGKRPESITVYLYDDEGKEVNSTVLNADNDWKATFKDLPVNRNGKEITYTVTENKVDEYELTFVDCCGNFKLINTYIPVNTTLTVSKNWVDEDNQDGIRPDSVTVKVLAGGEVVQTAIITESDSWTYTFTGLPKYSEGQEIVYTVEEVVPTGYKVSYSEDTLTITNTHITNVTEVNVTKVWNDSNNNDGVRPDSVTVELLADGVKVNSTVLSADNDWKATFKDLPVYKDGKAIVYNISEVSVANYTSEIKDCCGNFNIINTHINSTINLTVNKVWNDSDNNDGLRPESVTIVLYADDTEYDTAVVSGDEWTYTFTDLPEYDNGLKIVYTIKELEVPEGYVAAVDGLTVINTHEKITKNVTVTKIWNDSNNNDGIRPASVTVRLLADGNDTGLSVVLDESNAWYGVFNDLDVFKDGQEIVYNISEDAVDPYVVTITNVDDDFTLTNTYSITLINITVTKKWIDDDDNDRVRPESVSVNLYANGAKVNSTLLSSNNSWTHTFENLAKYENGQLITYNVTEDPVSQYITTITGDSTDFVITNTHDVELINLTINKEWNDTDNKYGKRPNNVTVNVFANGKQIDSIVLSKDNDWTCNLTDLPKYDDGKLINYSVDEVNITYYHYEIKTEDNQTFTVINTLNNVRIFKWAWKLIGDNGSYYEEYDMDDKVPANKGVIKKYTKYASKGYGIGRYQPRYNIPNNRKSSWNNNHRRDSHMRKISWQWYRLYIYLYKEYFYGNMSFSDFVAILQENGIQIDESNAWNANGTLIFDYDTLEEVPDSIELHDNGGHVKDSSDRVEKYNPRSSSGVIDSGEIVAEVVDVEE